MVDLRGEDGIDGLLVTGSNWLHGYWLPGYWLLVTDHCFHRGSLDAGYWRPGNVLVTIPG